MLRASRGSIGGDTTWTSAGYYEAIASSGLPGIFLGPERLRREQLDSYLRRVIDRDLPEQGFMVRRPQTLRRWLNAYAAASSTTTMYSKILDAATAGDGSQPAKTTTIAYRDLLSSGVPSQRGPPANRERGSRGRPRRGGNRGSSRRYRGQARRGGHGRRRTAPALATTAAKDSRRNNVGFEC